MALNDPPAPATSESTEQMMQAYRDYLPDILRITANNILPMEQAKLSGSEAVSPGYAKLSTDLFGEYGPQLAKIGSDIIKQQANDQALSDLSVVSGPGRQLVNEALTTAKAADPEYYNVREAAGNKLSALLGSINPTGGLDANETEAVTRGLAQENTRRGVAFNPSQTNTVANAMQFGNAAMAKKEKIGNILNATTSTAPALKSGIDVFQVATGKPSYANLGDTKFTGVTPVGSSTEQFGGNLLNNIATLQGQKNQINADRRDSIDRIHEGFAAVGSL